jgi:hypothetical protein
MLKQRVHQSLESQRHFLEEKHILDTMVALMCAYNWIGDSS